MAKPQLPQLKLPGIDNLLQANKGLTAVVKKEISDHLSGKRFIILVVLVVIACLASLYIAATAIREAGTDNFAFLKMFTVAGSKLPFSFTAFISFLGPLIGLIMGFDAISGERDRGTLSHVLSQPIYRDALINGKFIAGVAVLAMVIFGLGLLTGALGILIFGVPPTLSEFLRIITFLLLSIVYISFWLALSLLFSIVFRQTTTSALAGIALWLFFSLFATFLVGMIADAIFPVSDNSSASQILKNARLNHLLGRLCPNYLYDEATVTLMNPSVRALGVVTLEQLLGAIDAPLTYGQSLLLIWPHVVGLIAATLICFAVAYYAFMRQEIRA
ncbi:MAG: ABC transporter permease [Firmicutes bacterium]|jgi:ABC-2 type transport system permease protein|nr:ABC transporter permease [Bacillota bacterium]